MFTTLAAGWLVGCVPEEADDPPVAQTTPETTEPVDPLPWDWEPDDDPDGGGAMDLFLAAEALQLALEDLLSHDARPVIDAYNDVFYGSRSPTCPFVIDDGYGGMYWNDGCSATDGTYFGGFLSHYVFDGTYSDDLYYDGDSLGGSVTVITATGQVLDVEGSAAWIDGVSADGSLRIVQSLLYGGFGYTASSATGWLGDPSAVSVELLGIRVPSIDGTIVQVAGDSTVYLNGAPWAAQFTGNTMENSQIGSLCDLEPGGRIDLRDPSGRWIELQFDGPTLDVDLGDPTRCDGCADAVADGEVVGEVCADFTPWLTWEALP